MSQHRITAPGPLLNADGTLREPGWATSLLLDYDRRAIRAAGFRIKEWDYYLITNDRFGLALTVDDNSYMGLYSVSLLDFEKPWEHTASPMVWLPFGKTGLPASSAADAVTACLPNKKYDLRFEKKGSRRILDCRMDDFCDGKPLRAHVELVDAGEDSMVIATPYADDPKAFYYNQKINCMPAEGRVEYDGRTYTFEPDTAFGILDWGRGVWTYSNTWYWSGACGVVDGHRFGFNLGYGFGDTAAASENMLFYDGTAHKLGRVTFDIPQKDGRDDFLSPWQFSDDEGRLSLTFTPVLDRASKTDVLVICSDQHQVFGRFSGTVVLDDGTRLEIRDLMAFAEKVRNRW